MVDPKQPRSQAFGSAIDVCTNGTVSFQHVATYKSGVSHLHCTLSHVHMSTWTYRDLSVLAPLNILNQSRLCRISQTGIHWNSIQLSPDEFSERFPALQLGEELGRGHSLQILRRHAAWRIPGAVQDQSVTHRDTS